MKGVRIIMRNPLVLCLSIVLILFLTSCAKKEEAPEKAAPDLQAQVDELQKELNAKNEQIQQLQTRNTELQKRTPIFWSVEKGDKHWDIAMNFLTEKAGMSEDEAKQILKDSYLFDQLVVGFQVGNYSDGEKYGGFIVQGDAKISPAKWKRIMAINAEAKRVVLRNERTLAEVDTLRVKAEYKDKMREMDKEYRVLQAKAEVLEKKANSYYTQAKEFESWLHSVYYLAGSRDSLKARGKTDLGAIGFKDVMENRIDLRENPVIELSAEDFNVPEIKKVSIIPKTLQVNVDYRVEIAAGGQSAKVNLLKKDKFQIARIMIVIN